MKEQVSTLEKGANILLSLMQLNIGGAETHVVELAKELKRKGFNVIVASNGGVSAPPIFNCINDKRTLE